VMGDGFSGALAWQYDFNIFLILTSLFKSRQLKALISEHSCPST